ncbi:MAG: response regulator transcription factor [Oscillospiraceae bacterium]|nr:response regulator transcription factor [Oscillospiraceae bacterium]
MKTILCVEDELDLLINNCQNIENAGYNVLSAENLTQAREYLAATPPDLIVLDIMLPDGNGLEYLKELRAVGNDTPIIMLTALDRDDHAARGIEMGADDYIGKPFDYSNLLARIKRALAQTERIPKLITRDGLTLDIIANVALLDGEDLLFTQKEFSLLLIFVQNENRAVSAEYLHERVWLQPMNDDAAAVKSQIYNLRKKIANSGYSIVSKRNEGYIFEKPE